MDAALVCFRVPCAPDIRVLCSDPNQVGRAPAQACALIDESVTLFRDLNAYSSLAEILI
jgi:hypothetical protein